jgi:hypothetical protein
MRIQCATTVMRIGLSAVLGMSWVALAHGQGVQSVSPAATQRPAARSVSVPLPQPRPAEAGARTDDAPADAPPLSEGPPPPTECFLALTGELAQARQLAPIARDNGCEASDVVQLDAVVLRDRRRVAVTPPAVLRCPMATAVANWVRDDLLAALAAQGGTPVRIDNLDSFECRGMNRVVGAKTSEHGRANALDIRAIVLTGGQQLGLTDAGVPREFRENVRRSVCERFTTVLGPGSDGYHEDHVHIDLAMRRSGYRICQWDVRDPVTPLPRERPPEAPALDP